MLAFEVSLNGEVLYVAGFGEGLSLMAKIEVQKGRRDALLHTVIPSSVDGPPEQIQWGGNQKLSIGDSVTVKLVEVEPQVVSAPDEPKAPLGRGRFFTRS